eukprot:5522700-Prorocentrum_lima.AAC.1
MLLGLWECGETLAARMGRFSKVELEQLPHQWPSLMDSLYCPLDTRRVPGVSKYKFVALIKVH